MRKDRILITGSLGQLGSELAPALAGIYGKDSVFISDIRADRQESDLHYISLNVCDDKRLGEIVDKYKITQIYHLAAILSAKGEQDPHWAWQVNMDGTLHVLEIAREKNLDKVYFPSSIAVFGSNTPLHNTPQHTIMNPSTVYGISKLSGERWTEYYYQKFGVDARSLRYPGIISYKTLPGGGTTDYAVDIFHQAIQHGSYTSFLKRDTRLPMIYMPDAIKATLDLMEAPAEKISIRSSYNLTAMSFTPEELAQEIRKHLPNFQIDYAPDFRQEIADSWPASIDDQQARDDWAWQPSYDLLSLTQDMLLQLRHKYNINGTSDTHEQLADTLI